jgi:DNA-binding NarL/FixJ family response regulator
MYGCFTVLIVDDQQLFSDALSWRLEKEPDIKVIGTARTVEAALSCIHARRPDLVIVDGHLRTEGGIDAARALCELAQDARILVLGSNDDLGTVVQGLRAGAFGVLSRDTPTEKLLDVLRRLREGECYLPPRFVPTLLEQLRTALSEGEQSNLLDRLTERERDVLSLMVCGLDRPAIAGRLYLSLNTVRTHVRNILAKLEVHSGLEAVSIALSHGMRPHPGGESNGRARMAGTRGDASRP